MVSPGLSVSATVVVVIPRNITITDTTTIATNEAGTAFVYLGSFQIINIVNKTNPTIVPNSIKPLLRVLLKVNSPPEKSDESAGLSSMIEVKFGICDKKIIIAKPFTKPNITG